MIRPLKTTKKYYATQEVEALNLIEKVKQESEGDVAKQQIDRKEHKDYGEYFEITITEEFTNSKNILEKGY